MIQAAPRNNQAPLRRMAEGRLASFIHVPSAPKSALGRQRGKSVLSPPQVPERTGSRRRGRRAEMREKPTGGGALPLRRGAERAVAHSPPPVGNDERRPPAAAKRAQNRASSAPQRSEPRSKRPKT